MNFKRVICWFKGHKPFPGRDIPSVPSSGTVTLSPGHFTSVTTLGQFHSNGGLTINCGPTMAEAKVCSRCAGVYWNSKLNRSWLASTSAVPELHTYYKWQKRQSWEEQQRAENPLADKLYKQYQVALKLAKTDE